MLLATCRSASVLATVHAVGHPSSESRLVSILKRMDKRNRLAVSRAYQVADGLKTTGKDGLVVHQNGVAVFVVVDGPLLPSAVIATNRHLHERASDRTQPRTPLFAIQPAYSTDVIEA